MNLFELAAVLTLNRSDYDRGLQDAESKGSSFGSKLKAGLGGAAKAVGVAAAAAATGVAALTKNAVDSYADYEQLVGGVETLFGAGGKSLETYAKEQGKTVDEVKDEFNSMLETQNQALKNADNAYQTAGLSANEYMETISGFAASLKQSLGDENAWQLANYADEAVTDMADNANKMGTSMESIQNAYQGFAKQNYTMLDNLKLGYGGTKEEMERLLSDAEKLTGKKYDVSSFADIVEAIHAVQTEMGITGTTAKEASSTISGSVASMKSAWTNFVTGLGDENANLSQLISNVIDSAITAGENIIPRIEQILSGISDAIQKVMPQITNKVIPMINKMLPELAKSGMSILTSILSGISQNLPELATTAVEIVMMLINNISAMLPQLATAAIGVITALAQGISENIGSITETIVQLVVTIAEILTNPENLTSLLDAALQIITGLAQGLLDALPTLVDALPTIIQNIVDFLIASIPTIIDTGVQLLTALVMDLPNIIGQIVAVIPQIIGGISTAVVNNLDQIINAGIQLFVSLIAATPEIIGGIVAAIPDIISGIVDGFLSFGSAFVDIGKNLLGGIGEGIKNAAAGLWDGIKSVGSGIVNGFKSFFGIHSPSTLFRDQIGKNLALGLGIGFEGEMDGVTKTMQNALPTEFDTDVKANVDFDEYTDTVKAEDSAVYQAAGTAVKTVAQPVNGAAAQNPILVVVQLEGGIELGRKLIDLTNQARRADGSYYYN